MKILSITAGAAGMYCGSCFRDNALASGAARAGPRRDAAARVHADTHRRAERQPRSGAVRRHQRLSAAAFALFRQTPRLLDRLWDSPRGHRRVRGPGGLDRSRAAWRPDHLDAAGRPRRAAQGIRQAGRMDAQASRCRTSSICRTRCSSRMAAPLRRGARASGVLHAAGRGAVPRMACRALSGRRRSALIRQQVRHVDRFIAVSDYCARSCRSCSEFPPDRIDVVPLGISMDGYERRGRRATMVQGRLLRARGAGEGTARAGRRVRPLPARIGAPALGSRRRAILARRTKPI